LRPMILVLSLVLGLLPLVGIVWIFVSGMIVLWPFSATVDGLFMTLILLTLSACFLLNEYWEMRYRGLIGKKKVEPAKAPAASKRAAAPTGRKTYSKFSTTSPARDRAIGVSSGASGLPVLGSRMA